MNDSAEKRQGKRINIEFILLLISAFILSYIPFLNIPFTWFMTFFHEISHGLLALLTGGGIEKIVLHIKGSGLCYTTGGYRFVILQAGYIGAVCWGILMYEMADHISPKNSQRLAGCLAGLVAVVAILYGRDLITWLILLVIFGLFFSMIKLQYAYMIKLALKFIGIYILLDAVRAPLHLIDGRNYGDGAQLSDLTGVPELIWIMIWLLVGVSGLIYLWKTSQKITTP